MEFDVEGLDPGRIVARGSQGAVYRSREAALSRDVAVKLLDLPDEVARQRFAIEQVAMGRLSGGLGIVTVYRSGIAGDGRGYLVMEWMAGGSLREWPGGGTLGWEACAALGLRLARALAVAHEAGVVHGDIKPANILFDASGLPNLSDFGLSRIDGSGTDAGLTRAFAAPEVLRGESPTPESDVYSLAVVLAGVLAGGPGRPKGRSLGGPSQLEGLIDAAMATDPAGRPTAQGLAEVLDALVAEETVRDLPARAEAAGRGGRMVAAVIGALVLVGVFYATTLGSSRPQPVPASQLPLTPAELSAPTPEAPSLPSTTRSAGEVAVPSTTTTVPLFALTTTLVDELEVASIAMGESTPWSPVALGGRMYVAVGSTLASFDDSGTLIEEWGLSGTSSHPPLSLEGRIYQPVVRRACDGRCWAAHLDVLDPALGEVSSVNLGVEGRPSTPIPVPLDPWCTFASLRNTGDSDADCVGVDGSSLLWVRAGEAIVFVTAGDDPRRFASLYEEWLSDPSRSGNEVLVTRRDLHACIEEGRVGSDGLLYIKPACVRGDSIQMPADRLLLAGGAGLASLGTVRLVEPFVGEGLKGSGKGIAHGFVEWHGGTVASVVFIGRNQDLGANDQLSPHLHVAPDGAVWVLSTRSEAFRIDLSDLLADPEPVVRVGPCPADADRGFTECVRAEPGATALMVGETLLVPNAGDDAIHHLDTRTGGVPAVTSVGGDPGTPVLWDGVPWVIDTEGAAAVRLDPGEMSLRLSLACGVERCQPSPDSRFFEHRPVPVGDGLWVPWLGYLIRLPHP